MLAASTGTVAATSAIVSQPALAANGSEGCVFTFGAAPRVTVQGVNAGGSNKDVLNISVAPISGTCPCSPLTFEYAYRIVTRSSASGTITAQGGTGWTSWSTASVTSPTVLWPTGGGNPNGVVTVTVAVRVTCGTTEACRSGSSGPLPITNPSGRLTQTFDLTTSDCSISTAPGNVGFSQGALMMRTLEPAVEQPAVDLGPVEPAPTPADATTTTTTSVPAPSESSTSTTSTSDTPTQPLDE
jgi:hypothetical protein